ISGFRRGKGPRVRRAMPSPDAAIAIFALSLLLNFYITPSFGRWNLIPLLAVVEIFLVAAPAILLAWLARYRWRDTFSLRWPGAMMMLAGLLVGLGVVPFAQLFFSLQSQVFHTPADYVKNTMSIFMQPLQAHPILVPLLAGVLAGVCEELLYRGPIQTGLLKRMPIAAVLILGGILFAAAHLDLYGFAVRALLGIVLGWLVIRTRSIYPAMLAHGIYDTAQLLGLAHAVHTYGPDKVIEMATNTRGIDWQPIQLAIGAVLLAGAWIIFRKSAPIVAADAATSSTFTPPAPRLSIVTSPEDALR
ncbi:MAG TPA: type II CAAX endopeptidase family protein, partial [Tepidisphaeraceae bacterium]